MNWYAQAQKSQEGVKPSDIFSFYAASSLSDEALLESPKILYAAIDRLNKMREYYLQFLKKEIIEELTHAVDDFEESMDYVSPENKNEAYLRIKPEYDISFETWFEEYYPDYTDDVDDAPWYYEDEYDEFMQNVEYELDPQVEQQIKRAIYQFKNSSDYSYILIQEIKEFFNSLPWAYKKLHILNTTGEEGYAYGGDKWAEITQWFWVLYNTPSIELKDFNSIQFFRQLSTVIDTIHSLYHNNANVLVDLPNDEGFWLTQILDIVKHSPSQAGLSYFVQDEDLAKAIRRDVVSKGEQLPTNRAEYIKQVIHNFAAEIQNKNQSSNGGQTAVAVSDFVSNIAYAPILQVILELSTNEIVSQGIWTGLLYNPKLWQYEGLILQLLQKLAEAWGIEKALVLIKDAGKRLLSYKTKYSPDFISFLNNIGETSKRNEVLQYLHEKKIS